MLGHAQLRPFLSFLNDFVTVEVKVVGYSDDFRRRVFSEVLKDLVISSILLATIEMKYNQVGLMWNQSVKHRSDGLSSIASYSCVENL